MKNLKSILACFMAIFLFGEAYSQTAQLYNDGGTITILPNTSLRVNGDFVQVNSGSVENQGDIYLKGDLSNDGLPDIGGTFHFDGTASQEVLGTTDFYDIVMNNPVGVTFVQFAGLPANASVRNSIIIEQDAVFTAASNLTLKSDASGTAFLMDYSGLANPVSGNIVVERYIPNSSQGYRYLSAPGSNQTIQNIQGFTPSGSNGVEYEIVNYTNANANVTYNNWPTLLANAFKWDESLSSANGNRYWEGHVSGAMTPGAGYSVFIAGEQVLSFEGTPNTGNVNFSLTNTAIAPDASFDGWNFVGNPYPSPIDWDGVSTSYPAYVFDNTQDLNEYRGIYNSYLNGVASNPSAFNGEIAIGQSFFVKAPSNATLTFNNNARVASTTTEFFKTSQNNRSLVRMYVEHDNIKDYGVVYFEEGATLGYDFGKDAHKYFNAAQGVPSFYSLDPNNKYSIQALPELTTDMYVPLGLVADNAGTYTFNLVDLENIPSTSMVYFEDAETGTILDLRVHDSYTVHLAAGTYEGRFFIGVTAPLEVMTEDVLCTMTEGLIRIENSSETIWSYEISDTDGQLITAQTAVNGIEEISVPAGMYEVTLTHYSGYTVTELHEVSSLPSVTTEILADKTEVTVGEVVSFSHVSTGAQNYIWNFQDGTIVQDAGTVTHVYNEPGMYTVELYATNGTCDASSSYQLRVIGELALNAEEALTTAGLSVYGYNQTVKILFDNEEIAGKYIRIMNVLGQEVVSRDNRNAKSLDVSLSVPAGSGQIFFVVLQDETETITEKVFLTNN
jgi:hypothetical protein